MTLSLGARKIVLTAHLICSVGWIGGVVAYLALGITAVTSTEVPTIRAAWTAMEVVGWKALVPLAIGALLTGIVIAVGSTWGLLRHYWVVISLALTLFAAGVLLLHMPDVSTLASRAQVADATQLQALGGDLFHASVGLVVLLVIQVLNVYKPRGLTRYGRRQVLAQRERRARERVVTSGSQRG